MPNDEDQDQEPAWICLPCKEPVPESLDICWNCGASRDGVADPSFVKEPPADAVEQRPVRAVRGRPDYRCPKCGSSKLIPAAKILDQGNYSDGKLQVEIHGNPDALIFKDRRYAQLTADICGECGYVELKADSPDELYQHYLRSLE